MTRQLGVEYSGALDYFTARGKNRQPKVLDEIDRTEFLTRLGQEILSQRWRSAKSSNGPFPFSTKTLDIQYMPHCFSVIP